MRTSTTRSRAARLLILAAIALALLEHESLAGIRAGSELPLSNGGFELGLQDWSQWSTAAGQPFAGPSSGPQGGLTAVRFDVPAGEQAWMWNTVSTGAALPVPGPRELGLKLEFRARVYLPSGSTYDPGGRIALEVASAQGAQNTKIASSVPLSCATAPRDRWIELRSEALPLEDARVQAGATGVTVSLWVQTGGVVFVDDVVGGRFERAEFPLADGSFEDPTQPGAWEVGAGRVSGSDPVHERDAYWGERYLELLGPQPAHVFQRIPIGSDLDAPVPRQRVEAGAWIFLEDDGRLGAPIAAAWSPDVPLAPIALEVAAWTAGTPLADATVLARGSWSGRERGRWIHLHTSPTDSPRVPPEATHLLVHLRKRIGGTLRADFVQVGEEHGIDGNPRRLATCNYVGRYRSPDGPASWTLSPDPALEWHTWYWESPPTCDPAVTRFFHNPDCGSAPATCYRPNGRRDLAVSTERDIDELPLIGGYDSRDPHVLRYHAKLARAIGLDAFVYDYLGHTLAQELRGAGREAINEETFEALLDAVEEPGSDLKVCPLYEPKVHFTGWIPGEPTFQSRVDGIRADLEYLVLQYAGRKPMLRADGRLVVFLFRPRQCMQTGGGGELCLEDADWRGILDEVAARTGEELLLIGDIVPEDLDFAAGEPWYAESMEGMVQWQLVDLDFLRYRTFADAAAGSPTWPPANLADLQDHAAKVQRLPEQWHRQDDGRRRAVGLAWPGFDDSGVGGWGEANLTGLDSQPLCLRVAEDFGGLFFSQTLDAVRASDLDWVQVLTWNDWNEWTQIEPRWDGEYAQAAWSGSPPPAAAADRALGRALETQAFVAAFKGLALGVDLMPAEIDRVTRQYLEKARHDPGVVEYD